MTCKNLNFLLISGKAKTYYFLQAGEWHSKAVCTLACCSRGPHVESQREIKLEKYIFYFTDMVNVGFQIYQVQFCHKLALSSTNLRTHLVPLYDQARSFFCCQQLCRRTTISVVELLGVSQENSDSGREGLPTANLTIVFRSGVRD